MLRQIPPIALLVFFACSGVLPGCSSSEETEQETPPPANVPEPPREAPMTFHTRTDTVLAATPVPQKEPVVAARNPEIKYMVQIGAFKDAQNASRVQMLTRERYNMPVLNDFNTVIGVYQIKIGFFETKEAAYAFREKLVNDYPQDYRDAWVVQLMR